MTTNRTAVVLAAGKGTRIKSELPKVLVPVLGRPMIRYVLDTLRASGIGRVLVVVGYKSDLVRAELADEPGLTFVEQTQQLGTGHAVMVCRAELEQHEGPVLIVAGDSPLMQRESIETLLGHYDSRQPACILGTTHKEDPTNLGRIVRDSARRFLRIVEEKDATDLERKIREVNMSCYVFNSRDLLFALDRIGNQNKQGEYYLTDCPAVLLAAGRPVEALDVLKPIESLSINTPEELNAVEEVMQRLRA